MSQLGQDEGTKEGSLSQKAAGLRVKLRKCDFGDSENISTPAMPCVVAPNYLQVCS